MEITIMAMVEIIGVVVEEDCKKYDFIGRDFSKISLDFLNIGIYAK